MRVNLEEFKAQYFLFDPKSYGRIFAFVDFGNVRPWAEDIWPEENKRRITVEIDIAKIADICSWVNAGGRFFYYGYFPESGKANDDLRYRRSIFRIDKARKQGFKVKTKEIKMVPHYDTDGKFVGKFPKCNFDVEMTMDMLNKANDYDTVLLFSGDSDFSHLLKHLKALGKNIMIVCTRNRMSRELDEVAHKFIPAETLAAFLRYEPGV